MLTSQFLNGIFDSEAHGHMIVIPGYLMHF